MWGERLGLVGHDGAVSNAYVFRARSSYVWFGVTAFLLVFLLAETVLVDQSFNSRLFSWAIAAVIGVGAYLIFVRPHVVVFDEGITIVNPITSITVGWSEVDAIETRYAMSVQRGDQVVYAWAAPAPGRHHRRNVDPSEMRGMAHGGHEVIRPGDDPDTLSGSAAAIARRRWQEFATNNAPSAHYRKAVNIVGPLVVAVSALLALLVR